MKIEIAESLVYSWLRHCRMCEIVQTNWTVSPSWPTYNKEALSQIYDELENTIEDIWKQNSGVDQVIGQMECDVLGMSCAGGAITFHAVESAFHSRNLGYGGKDENCRRVIEKCAKIALALYGKLNQKTAEILFVCPKIGKPTVEDMRKQMAALQDILSKYGLSFNIDVCANEDFSALLNELMSNAAPNQVDDNELFMRAALMMKIGGHFSSCDCKQGRHNRPHASSGQPGDQPCTSPELAKVLAQKIDASQTNKINIFDDFADMFMRTREAYRNTYRSKRIDEAYANIFGYNPFVFDFANIKELVAQISIVERKCRRHLSNDDMNKLRWNEYSRKKTAGTASSLINVYKTFLPMLAAELRGN